MSVPNPKITVIAPVYNAARYLDRMVESIQDQTLQNWEMILIDDNSSDNSRAIIKRYAEIDRRIKYIFLDLNVGPARARNLGIDAANGEFLSFIDADDYVSNVFLERLLNSAEANNVDIVWCQYSEVVDNETLPKDNGLSRETVYNREKALKLFYGQTIGLGSLCNKLYRLEFINSFNLRLNEKRTRAEDWEFNLNAFSCLGSLIIIEDNLYYYVRQNNSSVMASFREKDFELMCSSSALLSEFNEKYCLGMNQNFDYDSNAYFFLEYIIKASLQPDDVSNRAINNVLYSKIFNNVILNCDIKKLPAMFRLVRIITLTKNTWIVKKFCRLAYGKKYRCY